MINYIVQLSIINRGYFHAFINELVQSRMWDISLQCYDAHVKTIIPLKILVVSQCFLLTNV